MTIDIAQIAEEYADRSPADILAFAFDNFDNMALSFSGAEDVVLIDMAVKIHSDLTVFCLDTGRLHPETYQYIEQIRDYYSISLEVLAPQKPMLDEFVKNKGLFSFYKDGHSECCGIRKVVPLRDRLLTLSAWITGQRHDQNPATRNMLPVIEIDKVFSSEHGQLIKFNPLAKWTSTQVWDYIYANKVPFNPLYQQGYMSIGCEPCTRTILPHQAERAGRWWWEDVSKKECGLHVDNAKP